MIKNILKTLLFSLQVLSAQEKENISYLDNGIIKVGVNLDKGGSITYLADSRNGRNLINNFDLGRQIQMSFYSGPVPYSANGQFPAKQWSHIGWNPIQSGDDFDNKSLIKVFELTENSIYVKCAPVQWPLNNISGDCFFETWISLKKNAVCYKARLTNFRKDKIQYPARHQELPAVYVNSDYYKLVTYKGTSPFTGDELHTNPEPLKAGQHWHQWYASENWAAFVNDDNYGLGVYKPGTGFFTGGFAGVPKSGSSTANATGYLAPVETEIIDYNIVYDYETYFIPGTLKEIRKFVYENKPVNQTSWKFKSDRQHWSIIGNTDSGWPIKESLKTSFKGKPGSYLVSPPLLLNASRTEALIMDMKYNGENSHFFISFDLTGSTAKTTKPFAVKVVKNIKFQTYKINLKDIPDCTGFIEKVKIYPFSENAGLNDTVEVKSIEFK